MVSGRLHAPCEAGERKQMRAVNVAGSMSPGVLPGAAPLFVRPTHSRDNAFDWETWHELDVLRRELAPRFAAKGP
jgi:hypothetical protein